MIEQIHADNTSLADAQEIERELLRLWRSVGESEKPMMRARVLSLVIVTSQARENEMVELMLQLAERHPARNILLLLDEETEAERLEADATLLCGMHARSLCAEQIRFHAAGSARERLPGAVRTLLTANLPVVLWWALPPEFESKLYQGLAALADRIFLDSASLPGGFSLQTLSGEWVNPRTSDLDWSRLTSWRETIAQLFDSPANRTYLPQLAQVHIESGAEGSTGWLLMGWLASRLGWQVERASREQVRFRRADGGAVDLSFATGEDGPGLARVTLEGAGARFVVQRVAADCSESIADLPGEAPLERMAHLTADSDAALLSRELDLMARDRVYEEALLVMRGVLEKQT